LSEGAGTFAALRNRQFRWLYASNMSFFLALHGQGILRSWLVYDLTGSEVALGMIAAAVALPMLVVAPFGGVIADRVERRGLIGMGQLLVLLSESSVWALLLLDRLTFAHLMAATLVMGFVFPFIMPARQAIVVNIVGRQGLTNAIALNMGGMNATRVLGNFSGFLIAPLGIERAYAFGVIAYAVALVCLRGVQAYPPHVAPERRLLANLGEGFRYMADTRVVLLLLVFGLIPMFLAMPFQQLLVAFAERVWDAGSSGFTLMSATAGLGGVAGSFFVAQRANEPRRVRLMLYSMAAFGGSLICFAQSPGLWLALPALFLATAFSSVFGALNNTAIQLVIPDHVRGRVSSFLMMSISLPILGTLPVGKAAELWGPALAVTGAAALALVSVVVFYALSPTIRGLDNTVRSALLAGEPEPLMSPTPVPRQ